MKFNITKELVKMKVRQLLDRCYEIDFLPSEKHRQNRMKIDKIIVEQNCITFFKNGEHQRWEWAIYVDFQNNPILCGSDAEEIMKMLIAHSDNVLESYLKS